MCQYVLPSSFCRRVRVSVEACVLSMLIKGKAEASYTCSWDRW